ncbi:hypothetical protein W648_01426, partial [Staphylococcus aureus VET0425R]
ELTLTYCHSVFNVRLSLTRFNYNSQVFVSQELFLIILFLKNKFPNSINSTNIILLCICSNFNSQIYTLLIF